MAEDHLGPSLQRNHPVPRQHQDPLSPKEEDRRYLKGRVGFLCEIEEESIHLLMKLTVNMKKYYAQKEEFLLLSCFTFWNADKANEDNL